MYAEAYNPNRGYMLLMYVIDTMHASAYLP